MLALFLRMEKMSVLINIVLFHFFFWPVYLYTIFHFYSTILNIYLLYYRHAATQPHNK